MAKIDEIATECQNDFARLLAVTNSQDSCVKGVLNGRDVQQMQERYDQWAGNLGALQHFQSSLSLELRLQDAPLVRKSILNTLEDLHVSVHDGKCPEAQLICLANLRQRPISLLAIV